MPTWHCCLVRDHILSANPGLLYSAILHKDKAKLKFACNAYHNPLLYNQFTDLVHNIYNEYRGLTLGQYKGSTSEDLERADQ